MKSNLVCIGISHQSAPARVRERLALDRDALARLLQDLGRAGLSGAVLSTCGRFEAYFSTTEHAPRECRAELLECLPESARPAARYWRALQGRDAASHLMRIASGLESQIIGEPHILGQVRDAFESATAARCIDPVVSSLFRAALHAGKRVRAETNLARPDASFADAAVAELRSHHPISLFRNTLLIGSGNLARSVARRFREFAPEGILIIVSRHRERGDEIAREFRGTLLDYADLPAAIDRADALIACTSPCSGRFIITPDLLEPRRNRPLVMIDLGLPRNIDPACAGRAFVAHKGLEDLGQFPDPDPSAIRLAESIIARELARFERWLAARQSHLRQVLASADPLDDRIRAATLRQRRAATDTPESPIPAGAAINREVAA